MTFTSFTFYLFLTFVYLVFYWTADRWRWLVLLTASYAFYATFKAPYLLVVLLMVTAISYTCGLKIAAQQQESAKKRWLWIGSTACVAILVLMKYLPFLEAQGNNLLGLNTAITRTLVSIGVSYFTFQAISYMADIYLEIEEEPERHFGRYALYLAFFPKLLQGPIERTGDLLPQLKKPYQFDYDAMLSGMILFTLGLFKKVVVADRFALYADQVFNNIHDYTGLPLLLGIYAYAFQIYFDFSAYTDMARGTGRIFGINLTENFNSPYLATSIADFWRRWHISFSRWILDYIFKPLQLGWRDWGQTGTALALLVTFIISGIWHGATWGFFIWGLLHGIYLASSTYYKPYQKKLYKWLGIEKSCWLKWWQMFVTFHLVSFAWVFFRANSVGNALTAVFSVFKVNHSFSFNQLLISDLSSMFVILLALALVHLLKIVHQYKNRIDVNCLSANHLIVHTLSVVIISIMFYLVIFCGVATKSFIYTQF